MKVTVNRSDTLMQVLWTHTSGLTDPSLSSQLDASSAARSYRTSMEKKILHEGKARTCAHYKMLHACSIAIVTHAALPTIPFCKVDKDGIPLELKPVKPFLTSSCRDAQRIGMTITRFYESITLPPQWDPTPITRTGPKLSKSLVAEFSEFCDWWTRKLNIQNVSPPIPDKIMGNLVQGPNGPSIMTSHYDARAVYDDKPLLHALYRLSSLTGSKWIWDMMVGLAQRVPSNNYLSGRISLLTQGGGKTRIIAIGDYWSQNILRGIHDKLMSILRRMVTDGTYDQDDQVRRIARESLGHKTFSYDLSNATDRFPLEMQKILLSYIFNKKISDAWADVLVSRDYAYRNERVRWAQGQPLGLLSSWAAFAITHHAVIEFCAWRKGRKTFMSYAVLGDDVAIWDEEVATVYKDLLMEMDVSINMSKSLVSDDRHHRVEFAKRILVDGDEVTGLKFNILSQASKSIYMLVDLLRVARLRSWNLSEAEFEAPSFLSSKGKELLSVLLWDLSGGVPPYLKGQASFPLDIQALRKLTLEARVASLKEKRDSLDKFLNRVKPIEELFKREGIAYSELQLGSLSDPVQHPVVWAVNQVGESLYETLGLLESCLDNEDGVYPPELPVEYLPIPTLSVYFGPRHRLRTEQHSMLVLTAWSKLKEMHSNN